MLIISVLGREKEEERRGARGGSQACGRSQPELIFLKPLNCHFPMPRQTQLALVGKAAAGASVQVQSLEAHDSPVHCGSHSGC